MIPRRSGGGLLTPSVVSVDAAGSTALLAPDAELPEGAARVAAWKRAIGLDAHCGGVVHVCVVDAGGVTEYTRLPREALEEDERARAALDAS